MKTEGPISKRIKDLIRSHHTWERKPPNMMIIGEEVFSDFKEEVEPFMLQKIDSKDLWYRGMRIVTTQDDINKIEVGRFRRV